MNWEEATLKEETLVMKQFLQPNNRGWLGLGVAVDTWTD